MKTQLRVLIVDDEYELRQSLVELLPREISEADFDIHIAENGRIALEKLIAQPSGFDLVLMDVRMPEMSGLEALKKMKEHDPRLLVVMITAHSNLPDAIAAIKEGAYDYVEKPIESARVAEIVRKAMETRELVSQLAFSRPIFDDDLETDFVGGSPKMREIFELISKLGRVEATVLVRGENGTGKELVARAIHSSSPRKSGPFVPINCGAIPEALMESELFGHERGAFTGAVERKIGKFQIANSGTLFLDEIGELRSDLQVKLLRVLQDKRFTPVGSAREVKTSARIIAATNRNLEKMIRDGKFREDLFYRLNVMPLFLPPLRERMEDIPSLVHHFIKKFSKIYPASPIRGISEDALGYLKRQAWPGNIRELENLIERVFVLETNSIISITSFGRMDQRPTPSSTENMRSAFSIADSEKERGHSDSSKAGSGTPLDFERFKQQSEKDFIIMALRANRGRINQTVALANIPKNTLLRKMKKYQITVKDILESKSDDGEAKAETPHPYESMINGPLS